MRGASARGSHSGALARTYSGGSGAALAWFIAGCGFASSARDGLSGLITAETALMDGSSSDPDLERAGVPLRVLAVPDHAVDQLGAAHGLLRETRFGRGRRRFVDIDAVHLLRDGEVIDVFLEQAPAAVLGHEPHAVGEEREGDVAVVVELHGVRVVPALADPVVVAAEHACEDHFLVGVDVGLVGDGLGGLLAV